MRRHLSAVALYDPGFVLVSFSFIVALLPQVLVALISWALMLSTLALAFDHRRRLRLEGGEWRIA